MSEPNRCPVCNAGFRGAAICTRCGADLERLMRLVVEAWQLRETARRAIAAGDFGRAFELAAKAQEIQSTRAGAALLRLSEWLDATPPPASQSPAPALPSSSRC